MLIDNFYKIANLISNENKLQAEIHLNTKHEVYKGHFPNQTVVPGVIQIQIIKELLETLFETNLMISEVFVAKYLRPITPEENPFLNIFIEYKLNETDDYQINASVSKDDFTFTKLKARLTISTI